MHQKDNLHGHFHLELNVSSVQMEISLTSRPFKQCYNYLGNTRQRLDSFRGLDDGWHDDL